MLTNPQEENLFKILVEASLVALDAVLDVSTRIPERSICELCFGFAPPPQKPVIDSPAFGSFVDRVIPNESDYFELKSYGE